MNEPLLSAYVPFWLLRIFPVAGSVRVANSDASLMMRLQDRHQASLCSRSCLAGVPVVVMRAPGFTLLEVLVALIIAAGGLGALFAGISGGLHAVQAADLTDQALSRARSHLDGLNGTTLSPGRQSGDDGGGFHWQTSVRAAGLTTTAGRQPAQMGLYEVAVTVSWESEGHTRQVEIDSQLLAVLSAAPP